MFPWTIAHQASLSKGFSRQEYWSRLPFPSPGDLPHPRSNQHLLHWQVDSLPLSHLGSPGHDFSSVQSSSVAQSCPTLFDPMNRSTPGPPVHHQLPEFTQTHYKIVALSETLDSKVCFPRGSISGWGRSPGGGKGNPLQYSCLENPLDREAWWARGCKRVKQDLVTKYNNNLNLTIDI